MLKLLTLLTFVALFCSCDEEGKKKARPNRSPIDVIIEKANLYKQLIGGVQDDFGFIYSDHCDSLLYSGLISASGVAVDIEAASNGNGKYYRTPYHDCFLGHGTNIPGRRASGSEISRDMFAGLFWSLRNNLNVGESKKIIEYGRKQDWIMGRGAIDRTYLTPNFVDTLYKLADRKYKGPKYFWLDPIKDHQRHVVALNIALQGDIDGYISNSMYDLIKKFNKISPSNMLFSFIRNRYSHGDQSNVIEFLSDDTYFPNERLPTSADYCSEWLWLRDDRKDSWRPCDDGLTHSGGDFLFIAYLLMRASEN